MTTNYNANLIGSITTLLASIGAINWGLVGILDYNLVSALLGEGNIMTRSVYVIVGISGIYSIFNMGKECSKKIISQL